MTRKRVKLVLPLQTWYLLSSAHVKDSAILPSYQCDLDMHSSDRRLSFFLNKMGTSMTSLPCHAIMGI